MCFNIKTGSLPVAPAIYFLQKLLGLISLSQQLSFGRTPDFFDLAKKLLTNYFKMRDREPFHFKEIL